MNNNKVVLVTGASRGIGFASAKLFYSLGYSLSLVSRNLNNLQEAWRGCDSSRILFLDYDLSEKANYKKIIELTTNRFSRIDVLVNNVGVNIRTPFLQYSQEEWSKVMDTNLTSAVFLSQAVGKLMQDQGSGKIINIASILGLKADSVSIAYGVSKAALISFTKYLAKELAPQVNVNCIAPGFVETAWHETKTEERINKIKAKIPLQRFAKPEEIADLVVFLVKKGDYLTGEVLVIDGGYTL